MTAPGRTIGTQRLIWICRELLLLALLAVSLLSFSKGYVDHLQYTGELYWVINYNNGLIRRGLLGHIVSFFIDQSDMNRVRLVVLYVHLTACMFLLLWIWSRLRTILNHGSEGLLMSIFAVFATSQFLPTQAYDTGLLDVYDYVLVLAATVAILGDLYFVAGVIGFIGPFVHEPFLFVWLALATLVVWEGIDTRRFAVLVSPFVAACIIYLVPTEEASIAQMASAPLPQGTLDFPLSQTISSSFQILLWKHRYNAANFMMAAGFFTLPAAVIVLAYGVTRKHVRDVLAPILAGFIPATLLVFAWDLSRLLVATVFTSLLAVIFMHSVAPIRATRFHVTVGCWMVAALFFLTPFIYAYFELCYVIDNGPVKVASTPIGKLATAAALFYSRNIGPRVVPEVGTDDPPGTVWYEEENAWRNVWTRRLGTNTFDASGTLGGLTVITCLLTITRGGNRIRVVREGCSDGNNLMYAGEIVGSEVHGTYPGGKWHATIH